MYMFHFITLYKKINIQTNLDIGFYLA